MRDDPFAEHEDPARVKRARELVDQDPTLRKLKGNSPVLPRKTARLGQEDRTSPEKEADKAGEEKTLLPWDLTSHDSRAADPPSHEARIAAGQQKGNAMIGRNALRALVNEAEAGKIEDPMGQVLRGKQALEGQLPDQATLEEITDRLIKLRDAARVAATKRALTTGDIGNLDVDYSKPGKGFDVGGEENPDHGLNIAERARLQDKSYFI